MPLDLADVLAGGALLRFSSFTSLRRFDSSARSISGQLLVRLANLLDDAFDGFDKAAAHLRAEGEAADALRQIDELVGVLAAQPLELTRSLRLRLDLAGKLAAAYREL